MNANPSAVAPTEGSAAVRLGTALEYAQKKSGDSLDSILDHVLDVHFQFEYDLDARDDALIQSIYEWAQDE